MHSRFFLITFISRVRRGALPRGGILPERLSRRHTEGGPLPEAAHSHPFCAVADNFHCIGTCIIHPKNATIMAAFTNTRIAAALMLALVANSRSPASPPSVRPTHSWGTKCRRQGRGGERARTSRERQNGLNGNGKPTRAVTFLANMGRETKIRTTLACMIFGRTGGGGGRKLFRPVLREHGNRCQSARIRT